MTRSGDPPLNSLIKSPAFEEADDVDLDGKEEPNPFNEGLNGGCCGVVPARAKLPGGA